MSNVVTETYPTYAETYRAIPEGRMPYFWSRQILAMPEAERGIRPQRCIDLAAKAHESGVLSPPLEGALEDIVKRAAGFLDQPATLSGPLPINWHAADAILELLVEHGYRSDNG